MKLYTFVPSHTLLRSVLHFFPSAMRVAAPYPVICKVTFFQQDTVLKSMALDGLRLSQPDGIQIEDLLIGIESEKLHGLIGVEIELDTKGRNADLSPSDCIVEIECQEYSVQYRAVVGGVSAPEGVCPVPNLPSDDHNASLVLINGSDEEKLVACGRDEGRKEIRLAPRQVFEQAIASDSDEFVIGFDQGDLPEGGGVPEGVFGYLMYRDMQSHLPLSVSQL